MPDEVFELVFLDDIWAGQEGDWYNTD